MLAAFRATQLQWLAGHTRRCITVCLTVFIHKPAHDLSICIYIRCRNIDVRTDEGVYCPEKSPGQAFHFIPAVLAGVYLDAAFPAAVGNIEQGCFPRHQCG